MYFKTNAREKQKEKHKAAINFNFPPSIFLNNSHPSPTYS